MIHAALADVADINPRLSDRPPADEPVAFLGMADVDASNGTTTVGESRSYASVAKGYTPFLDGDLLVAKITPCFENGKIAQAKLRHAIGMGSTEFHVIRPRSDALDPRYALHMLRTPTVRAAGERRMTGSGGQRRVPADYLRSLRIPLPHMSEQRRIADILDRADSLVAKRRQSLTLLEHLTASLPSHRPSQAAHASTGVTLGDVADVQIGPFGSLLHAHDYVTDGVAMINPMHIVRGRIVPDRSTSVTETKAAELSNYLLYEGDIIMGRRGEMGRCAVVTAENEGSLCGTGSIIIRPRTDRATSNFLAGLLGSPAVKRKLEQASLGSTLPNLNSTIVMGLDLDIPSLEVQMSSDAMTARIERRKQMATVSSDLLYALFGSLQHRAFRGEEL